VNHEPSAEFDPRGGHGYEWRPVCSCGWAHPVRYAAEHAALAMATDHARRAAA
jgi:hypothetical protein